MKKGIVRKSTGSWYEVKTQDGKILSCRIKGKLRLNDSDLTNPVAVGDVVLLDGEGDSVVISDIIDRKNYFVRESPKKQSDRHVLAANIDQVVLVVTISLPRTSLGFIDRLLVINELQGIKTVILFNKTDIQVPKHLKKQHEAVEIYKGLGYDCLETSFLNDGVEKIIPYLENKTSLITGHSGSGKSTLVNQLIPEIDLDTREISKKFQKGQHTTTYTCMYDLPSSGQVIDSPGIKELAMLNIDTAHIGHGFVEIRALENDCKYNNCLHINEPNCAVKEALEKGSIHQSRYNSYINIIEELQKKRHY